jgi:uncharacterized membrane protein (DUF2068 family)
MLLSLGVVGLVLAFGLWRHRVWARPLAVATCAVVPIILALPDHESRRDLASAMIASVIAAGVAGLYFYGVRRVRAYYAQLIKGPELDLRPNGR